MLTPLAHLSKRASSTASEILQALGYLSKKASVGVSEILLSLSGLIKRVSTYVSETISSRSELSKNSNAIYVDEAIFIDAQPPPPPPPPITITPSNETVNFQGYTTTILFRDPSYLLRYVKREDLSRIILMSDVASVFNISNITLLIYQPDQSVAYFLTFAKDRVLTWIAFKENDIIYYINNFSVDPNSKKWIINNYLAIQVNQTVINALIAYFYYQGNFTGSVSNLTALVPYVNIVNTSLPFTSFRSMFVSYDYQARQGWVLSLQVETDQGVRKYYLDVNLLVALAYILLQKISLSDLGFYGSYEGPYLVSGIVDSVSFAYNITANIPPQYLIIVSERKWLDINYTLSSVVRIISMNTTSGLTTVGCEGWLQFFINRNIYINESAIPACKSIQITNITYTNPINYTPPAEAYYQVGSYELKRYQLPDWWNIPGWFSFMAELFTDFFSFLLLMISNVASFVPYVLSPEIWKLLLLVFIIANAVLALYNPAMLPALYIEIFNIVRWLVSTIYFAIMYLIQTIAQLIKAIRPF